MHGVLLPAFGALPFVEVTAAFTTCLLHNHLGFHRSFHHFAGFHFGFCFLLQDHRSFRGIFSAQSMHIIHQLAKGIHHPRANPAHQRPQPRTQNANQCRPECMGCKENRQTCDYADTDTDIANNFRCALNFFANIAKHDFLYILHFPTDVVKHAFTLLLYAVFSLFLLYTLRSILSIYLQM